MRRTIVKYSNIQIFVLLPDTSPVNPVSEYREGPQTLRDGVVEIVQVASQNSFFLIVDSCMFLSARSAVLGLTYLIVD